MDAQIAELHAQGKSCSAIAKELGKPLATVWRHLQKMGLSVADRNMRTKGAAMRANSQAIIDAYLTGDTPPDLAKRYDCDRSTITRMLQKAGVEARTMYSIDEGFFEEIDTEAKAYTLGFFTADGCLNRDGTAIIRICDRDVLEKIQAAMNHNGVIAEIPPPPDHPNRKTLYSLQFRRRRIADGLRKWGCGSAKTFTTQFPYNIPLDLYRHFIRGLFDGDGSIYACARPRFKTHQWSFRIAGTASLLGSVLDIIRQATNVGGGVYPSERIFYIDVAGRDQIRRVLDWLYCDSTIHMDRKFALYQQFLTEQRE